MFCSSRISSLIIPQSRSSVNPHTRGSGSVSKSLLETKKSMEEIERKISIAMSTSDIHAEAVIAIAYSSVNPEWLFGSYKCVEEIDRINSLLEKQGLKISKIEEDGLYNISKIQ